MWDPDSFRRRRYDVVFYSYDMFTFGCCSPDVLPRFPCATRQDLRLSGVTEGLTLGFSGDDDSLLKLRIQ